MQSNIISHDKDEQLKDEQEIIPIGEQAMIYGSEINKYSIITGVYC